MIAKIAARLKESATWIYLIISAGFILFVGLLFYGQRKVREGDAAATLRSDRERLQDAEESGDDDRILDEWRRSRR